MEETSESGGFAFPCTIPTGMNTIFKHANHVHALCFGPQLARAFMRYEPLRARER